MVKFTEKQLEAVYTKDCDLLVSAAAGSGKTAVLSERILRSVIDKDRLMSVTDFLVVTFTNAAASEMKDRIGKKIMEAASDKSLEPQLRNHLKRQLTLLGKASITTIHAFCLDIIRNNFHLLEIDPAVRVADKNEVEILKLQVAEEMLEEMYTKRGATFSELCEFFGGTDDKVIAKILEIYSFLNGFPKPIDWLKEKINEYLPENYADVSELPWLVKLKNNDSVALDRLIVSCKKLLDRACSEGIESYAETLENDLEILRDYRRLFDGDVNLLLGKSPTFCSIKPKPRDADELICEKIKNKRNDIKDELNEISANYVYSSESLLAQLEKAYPVLKCLEESICTFDRIFKEKKKKSSIIDFSDFEHLALEILSDESNGVAEDLRTRFSEIMIDEYQDCNQTQEMIFSYINRRIDGKSSNMFMVGDIKQSIYRFRLADPEIFADKNRRYHSKGLQRKIVLNKNFRSSSTILDGVNAIFEKIMTEKCGGVNYSSDEKLYYQSDKVDKATEEKCELVIVDNSLSNSENGQAEYVADKILSLVEKGYKFKDIAILVRGMVGKAQQLEAAFKDRNIPYFSDRGNGYFESLEISMLSSMLRVIDNPMQDIELVALLRSPAFKFDENLLADIRLCKKGPFYGALIKYSSGDTEGAEKCRSFLNRLSIWRDKVLFMPVDKFIEYVITDSGLDVFAASLSGGEQRSANLRLFVLQARLLQNSGFNGLFSFVSYMDRLSAGGEGVEAKLLSENSNVVRIMTIHKSKGLEFPVVFLFGCQTAFNKKDLSKEVILHKDSGIGLKFTDVKRKIRYPMISHIAVKNDIARDNISEEMRVLYVALTRPKEKLICTAEIRDAKKYLESIADESFDARQASCYLDWIALASGDDNWEVNIISADGVDATMCDDENTSKEYRSDSIESHDVFGFVYPHKKATGLPTKLSVSEIKRRRNIESAEETKLFIPAIKEYPSFIEQAELSAADVGVINHLVLRHIDIAQHNVSVCVSELIEKGLMQESESRYVDAEGIERFFKSNLAERLLKAEKVYRELAFSIEVLADDIFPSQGYGEDTIIVQGIIDLVFVEKGKAIVVDYKTDRYIDNEKVKKYGVQLDMYAKAIKKMLNLDVEEKYLYSLRKNDLIKF